jgi:hypothetical protein
MVNANLTSEQTNYLQKFVNSIAGFHLPLEEINSEVQLKIFNFITRKEETDCRHRDQWGNWEGCFSAAHLVGKLSFPWVDELINDTARQYFNSHPNLFRQTKYPGNKPFALCITHDVDDTNQFPSFMQFLHALERFSQCKYYSAKAVKLIILKTLKELACNNEQHLKALDFYQLMEIEANCGFKSTFYCFSDKLLQPHFYDSLYQYSNDVLYMGKKVQMKSVLRQIQQAGWEVGLHGSYNSAFNYDNLKYEKERLEQITGQQIQSTRQHWMHYDITRTPQIHEQVGLSSDSTLGFNRSIGFRAGTSHPFRQWDVVNNKPLELLEIPQVIMDGALFYEHSLELSEELALKNCFAIMDRVEAAGGVLTISWHPNHINKPRFLNTFKAVLKEALRRNAWGCSATELSNQWNNYLQACTRDNLVTRL